MARGSIGERFVLGFALVVSTVLFLACLAMILIVPAAD